MRAVAADLRVHARGQYVVRHRLAAPAARPGRDSLRPPAQVFPRGVGKAATVVQAAHDFVPHERAAAPALLRIENECTGRAERGSDK